MNASELISELEGLLAAPTPEEGWRSARELAIALFGNDKPYRQNHVRALLHTLAASGRLETRRTVLPSKLSGIPCFTVLYRLKETTNDP